LRSLVQVLSSSWGQPQPPLIVFFRLPDFIADAEIFIHFEAVSTGVLVSPGSDGESG